jgi:hypothetical protein
MKPSYPVGIAAIQWWSSPSCLRILDRLACKGPTTPNVIAAELHNQEKYAYRLLRRVLINAGRVHVIGYEHNINGSPTPIYAIGPGESVPRPAPESASVRSKQRRKSLNAKFGTRITQKLLNPKRHGYPQVHIDGHRVRCADHDAHLATRTMGKS